MKHLVNRGVSELGKRKLAPDAWKEHVKIISTGNKGLHDLKCNYCKKQWTGEVASGLCDGPGYQGLSCCF